MVEDYRNNEHNQTHTTIKKQSTSCKNKWGIIYGDFENNFYYMLG
jgi:hypothetical protein